MIIEEVSGLYKIIMLKFYRQTPGVFFEMLEDSDIPETTAIDRVIHEYGAVSPGPVGTTPRPWYMHPHQDDNLMVLHGTRYVDIYTPTHGKVEHFTITPHQVIKNDEIIVDGAAMLVWPHGVFHRIKSCDKEGSASINFATRYEHFDVNTNFNIYDLNTATGQFEVLREGHLDQP
jgi:hypothetical protein